MTDDMEEFEKEHESLTEVVKRIDEVLGRIRNATSFPAMGVYEYEIALVHEAQTFLVSMLEMKGRIAGHVSFGAKIEEAIEQACKVLLAAFAGEESTTQTADPPAPTEKPAESRTNEAERTVPAQPDAVAPPAKGIWSGAGFKLVGELRELATLIQQQGLEGAIEKLQPGGTGFGCVETCCRMRRVAEYIQTQIRYFGNRADESKRPAAPGKGTPKDTAVTVNEKMWVACTIENSGFSGERKFEVILLDGRTVEGVASVEYLRSEYGGPLLPEFPLSGETVNGLVQCRVLRQENDGTAVVTFPGTDLLYVPKEVLTSVRSDIKNASAILPKSEWKTIDEADVERMIANARKAIPIQTGRQIKEPDSCTKLGTTLLASNIFVPIYAEEFKLPITTNCPHKYAMIDMQTGRVLILDPTVKLAANQLHVSYLPEKEARQRVKEVQERTWE